MSADLISGVIIPRVGLKQVVTRGELEGHAGGGPDVGRGVVAGAEEDLQGPVLPGLDVLRVVVRHPAGVTQVGYLALQLRHDLMDRILLTAINLFRAIVQSEILFGGRFWSVSGLFRTLGTLRNGRGEEGLKKLKNNPI